VTITSRAPAGLSILIAATVSKSLTIPVGKTSATFTVETTAVKSETSSTISASLGSASDTSVLAIS